MVTHDAILDVPRELVLEVSRLLAAERRERGTRRGARALTCFKQALLVLRHFREAAIAEALARDNTISRATAYRYIGEGTDVLARNAPELAEVLEQALSRGRTVILDGKLFESDRCRLPKPDDSGTDLWYSGHKCHHGGNVQLLADDRGKPLWSSPAEPGSVSDITAARLHVLPLLRKAAKQGLTTFADLGYEGAGTGVHVPVKRPKDVAPDRFSADNRAANLLLRGLRAVGERAFALLVGRWRLLRRTTKSPSRIGDLVKAALVLYKLEKQTH
ncbi:transposase family protein [Nocardiopsis suaedae]|uniref:IS5/IS1182 family transposase n=1 Tax=Nocardiopsis suaedae TaxID=3018444 RepID=A0ABT4TLK9_9ACTN|nr:transposase family protein [Nocardiopsis suaedae]MDA2804972.1 IS5/IS1182 family transposase [Nocardiopsis suaedae]